MLNQTAMFPAGDDLPLFSGTAQRDTSTPFVATITEPLEQVGFPVVCRACRDTGLVVRSRGLHNPGLRPYQRCICPAGQAPGLGR